EDGYDGPQGGGYPEPQGARDIYSYYVKGTSTKTKINTVPQAPFSDRWLKENAGAASGFFSRADEAGKLIWENNPNQNWWGNRMDDVRGIIQGAVNPFLTGFQGVGIGAITDSAVSPVTDTAAQQTLQGINDLGKLSPEAQLAAASLLQDSAFAVKDGINSARQWADAHPNITATAQTALAVAEAAGTVWGGKKVELNPAKWDWVKNTGYEKPAARPMQTVDGEMAGGNKPIKSLPNSAAEKRKQSFKKFSSNWSSASFDSVHKTLTPNAPGILSPDKVKTRYTSLDGKITIIKDNENNYFRIHDNSRKQYLDSNGNAVKTGNLQGKQAKDYLQQQTHIRNLDK
ncbi:TPA: polymorphic toxin MafB class 3, partial [Neisseria gonorrhoeae]